MKPIELARNIRGTLLSKRKQHENEALKNKRQKSKLACGEKFRISYDSTTFLLPRRNVMRNIIEHIL